MSTELVQVTQGQRRCALYRHFDNSGTLLYVGITESPSDRTNGHARSSQWVEHADYAEMQWYPDRAAAEQAERVAIQAEEPVFNRQHALGDVEERIAKYLHEREKRELERPLEMFEEAVELLIETLPPAVRKQAEEIAQRDYRQAEVAIDRAFPARLLKRAVPLLREHLAAIQDDAAVAASMVIRDQIDKFITNIKEDAEARNAPDDPWAPAVEAPEPPF